MTDATPTAVDRLIDALRAHAQAVASSQDEVTALPVISELRCAALDYVDAVFDASGWGNAFANLDDDADEEVEEDWRVEEDYVAPDGLRLSLTGRWDFVVSDGAALTEAVVRGILAARPELDEAELTAHYSNPVGALDQLLGQDFVDFPGLEGAGSGWTVSPVDRTLFEMSTEERFQTGS